MNEHWQNEYMEAPYSDSVKQQLLQHLAQQYHERCEAYDFRVCTGWNYRGTAVPQSVQEMRDCGRNSRLVFADLADKAVAGGCSVSDLHLAIVNYKED